MFLALLPVCPLLGIGWVCWTLPNDCLLIALVGMGIAVASITSLLWGVALMFDRWDTPPDPSA